jgi:HSP20 family protein
MNAVAEKENQMETPQPATAGRVFVAPQVNIVETANGYSLAAEMPGVNKEGLTVDVAGNVLTLEGRRRAPSVSGNQVYRESKPATYRRVFELDPEIDTARITARIEQGVLTLQMPKAEKTKPHKINVN